jgi:hypothetical protein
MTREEQYASFFSRARTLKREIEQQFNDCAHWNRLHPKEEPIDPDPDGSLASCLAYCDGIFER